MMGDYSTDQDVLMHGGGVTGSIVGERETGAVTKGGQKIPPGYTVDHEGTRSERVRPMTPAELQREQRLRPPETRRDVGPKAPPAPTVAPTVTVIPPASLLQKLLAPGPFGLSNGATIAAAVGAGFLLGRWLGQKKGAK